MKRVEHEDGSVSVQMALADVNSYMKQRPAQELQDYPPLEELTFSDMVESTTCVRHFALRALDRPEMDRHQV